MKSNFLAIFWRSIAAFCSIVLLACDRSDKSEKLGDSYQAQPPENSAPPGIVPPVLPNQESPPPVPSLESEAREQVERWKEQIWQKKEDSFYAVLFVSKSQQHLGMRTPPEINRYLIEAKGLKLNINQKNISQADQMNGLEWAGSFQHFASVSRCKSLGSEWVDSLWNPDDSLNPVYDIEKRNGEWRISLSSISSLFGKSMTYEKSTMPID